MHARPVAVEYSMTLDRTLEIENKLPRTLRVFKDRPHHRRLIGVLLLVRRAVKGLNILLVYVLQIGIHCYKQEGTTVFSSGDSSNSCWAW